MQEFEKSKTVNANPDQVFEYVSDLGNLPEYLPTLRRAEQVGGDRIRVEGQAAGKSYEETGFFRTDRQSRRMEWGSDGENGYSGWLEVKEAGRGASDVRVHLSFDPQDHALKEMDRHTGDHERAVNEGIENTLQSIKNLCEGRGGKVESAKQR
jgi:uncharacterized membrane protein